MNLKFDPIKTMRYCIKHGLGAFPDTKNGDALIAVLDNESDALEKCDADLNQELGRRKRCDCSLTYFHGMVQTSVLNAMGTEWKSAKAIAETCGRTAEQTGCALNHLHQTGAVEKQHGKPLKWRKK